MSSSSESENKKTNSLKTTLWSIFVHIVTIIFAIVVYEYLSPYVKNRLLGPKIEVHVLEYNMDDLIENTVPKEELTKVQPFLNLIQGVSGLKILVKNTSNQTAKDISFNLNIDGCKIKSTSIGKTNADCNVTVKPSTNLKMIYKNSAYIDVDPKKISDINDAYFFQIDKLRKYSEVEIKLSSICNKNLCYSFSKILSDNAQIKIFSNSEKCTNNLEDDK